MKPKLVGIAGGSGAGKSTVCYELLDSHPDLFEVINLDDYHKKKTEPDLPMIDGRINWDHPDIITWEKLLADIGTLLSGNEVVIETWSHRSNPDYAQHRTMIPRTIKPAPIMLLEGYLALYNDELNTKYARKYYLELDDTTRNSRRGKNGLAGGEGYVESVVLPMHRQYVEPTKTKADKVLDVSQMSVSDVCSVLYEDLKSSVL